ncbi:hypothetical protein ACH4TV_15290 [Streptomyces sp. NPDC020898]|uniref:hypothetical protein n=1 Tax=Streptomyces sp. NPDC020898 TaxID=3365101 RepID=UPI0037B886A9
MPLASLVLISGRSVELTALHLSSTYSGFLEGYPCRPVNDMKTKGLLHTAGLTFPASPVHLIRPPLERPDTGPPVGPFGPVEVLPAVACIGAFSSTPVASDHDPLLYRSALTVVWFQATATVPSGDDADSALHAISWEELALDHEL